MIARVDRARERLTVTLKGHDGKPIDLTPPHNEACFGETPDLSDYDLPAELKGLLMGSDLGSFGTCPDRVCEGKHARRSTVVRSLLAWWWPDFVEYDGCVLRAGSGPLEAVSRQPTKTDAECFLNHVHIWDTLPIETPVRKRWFSDDDCYRVADMWMHKLNAEFPDRRFVVYLFIDGRDTTLRFHTYRHGEGLWADLALRYEGLRRATIWFI